MCQCAAPTLSEVSAFAQAAALLERHHGSTVPVAARAFLVEHIGDMAPRAAQGPTAGWTCKICGFWHPDAHARCGKWCSSVPKPPAKTRQPTKASPKSAAAWWVPPRTPTDTFAVPKSWAPRPAPAPASASRCDASYAEDGLWGAFAAAGPAVELEAAAPAEAFTSAQAKELACREGKQDLDELYDIRRLVVPSGKSGRGYAAVLALLDLRIAEQTQKNWASKPLAQQSQSLHAQRANLAAKVDKCTAVVADTREKLEALQDELESQQAAEDQHRAALEQCDLAIQALEAQSAPDCASWPVDAAGDFVVQTSQERMAVQSCLAQLRKQAAAFPSDDEASLHFQYPSPTTPSTSATKRKAARTCVPPNECMEVEEVSDQEELVEDSPSQPASLPYGKGASRRANVARRTADPYATCSPVTPDVQPASAAPPAMLSLVDAVPSAARDFQQGAVTAATVQ